MLVSALTIAGTSLVNKKQSLTTSRTNQAFQVADSAVEIALARIYKQSDATPSALATQLSAGGSCFGGTISGSVSQGSYKVTLYDSANVPIPCASTTWRDDVVRLRSEGTKGDTSRVIETAVAAAGGCGWVNIDGGGTEVNPGMTASNAAYVRYLGGADHSPVKMCQNAGYSFSSGMCKGEDEFNAGRKMQGSVIANNVVGDWSITCHWGHDSYYLSDDPTKSQILCCD
jgi:hypothetical protein